jgi:hypothetical protein
MSDREFLQVDPATLHLPGSRQDGVDPMKLHRQMARHGLSIAGMPPLEVSRGTDASREISAGHVGDRRSYGRAPRGGRWVAYGKGAAMTTEETRAELLEALAELGRAHPNWRLGQTLSNVAMAAGRLEAGGVWDLEDDEALVAARLLLGRRAEVPAGKA